MNELFGSTRNVVEDRYALLTPSGFVPGNLPGWSDVVCHTLISPGMGANFAQFFVTFNKGGVGLGHAGSTQYFVYVLNGKCSSEISGKKQKMFKGSYAYIPPGEEFRFSDATPRTRLLVFQKKYEMIRGFEKPDPLVRHEKSVKSEPIPGNSKARLQVLLPDHAQFDMAVTISTFQSGAALPFVETHTTEHGLVMLSGQGIYRLDTDYHPVKTDDVIWTAPYCPQWFVAMGRTAASYICYKNVNRAPQL